RAARSGLTLSLGEGAACPHGEAIEAPGRASEGGGRAGRSASRKGGTAQPAAFIGTLTGGVQVCLHPNSVNPRKSFPASVFLSRSHNRPALRFQPMRIALYEPDIPQNTGTILRLAACLGLEAHIIEPAGFPTSDRAFRRAGMDYLDQVALVRHPNWDTFEAWHRRMGGRLVLFTTRATLSYY